MKIRISGGERNNSSSAVKASPTESAQGSRCLTPLFSVSTLPWLVTRVSPLTLLGRSYTAIVDNFLRGCPNGAFFPYRGRTLR